MAHLGDEQRMEVSYIYIPPGRFSGCEYQVAPWAVFGREGNAESERVEVLQD